MHRFLVAWLGLGVASFALAQSPDDSLAEVRMADGSVVRLVMMQESIEVATKFGKLTVPLRDIERIEFGLRYPAGLEAKIQQAVTDLAHTDFRKREAAQAALLGWEEFAYPIVVRSSQSTHPEIAKRSKTIVEEMKRSISEVRLDAKSHDAIFTTEFPINGRILTESWKARSRVFGETNLKLNDLRRIRLLSHPDRPDSNP